MKILVTGANGHIGANVVRDLLEHDHEPVPFVRASSNQIGLEDRGLGDGGHVRMSLGLY